MNEYYVAWWNVENLFEVEDYPDRSDKRRRTLKNELKGWTKEILDKKLSQLSKIISKMNNSNGPDILGICEVENKSVIEKLLNNLSNLQQHTYHIAHADTKDERGIDVAFIYDSNKFEIEKDQHTGTDLIFSHFIVKREASRDILQVNFKTKPLGNRLVLIGNHWPSRSSGQYESEPYRIVAGETLSYFHKRILEENKTGEEDDEEEEQNTPILVMGDFNDEPFNRSVTDYALATTSMLKVKLSKEAPRLYNLMWPIMAKGVGTFYFNNFPNFLDQFMVSRGIVIAKKIRVNENSTEIIAFPEMVKGQYKVPIKFGRPSGNSLNENGFSDHLPISVTLEED
jgi:endonuclease/exonuclease/phosphatase family metal-dependent hydrolase